MGLVAGGYGSQDIGAALKRYKSDVSCAESCLAYARTPRARRSGVDGVWVGALGVFFHGFVMTTDVMQCEIM